VKLRNLLLARPAAIAFLVDSADILQTGGNLASSLDPEQFLAEMNIFIHILDRESRRISLRHNILGLAVQIETLSAAVAYERSRPQFKSNPAA
jgi:hypothetical protein